jgi:hypothetical protein
MQAGGGWNGGGYNNPSQQQVEQCLIRKNKKCFRLLKSNPKWGFPASFYEHLVCKMTTPGHTLFVGISLLCCFRNFYPKQRAGWAQEGLGDNVMGMQQGLYPGMGSNSSPGGHGKSNNIMHLSELMWMQEAIESSLWSQASLFTFVPMAP